MPTWLTRYSASSISSEVVGEGFVAKLVEKEGDVGFLEDDLAHGDERRAGGFGVLDEVLPSIGVIFFEDDGGNVFGDKRTETAHSVAGDEGHHIVFERDKIVRLH